MSNVKKVFVLYFDSYDGAEPIRAFATEKQATEYLAAKGEYLNTQNPDTGFVYRIAEMRFDECKVDKVECEYCHAEYPIIEINDIYAYVDGEGEGELCVDHDDNSVVETSKINYCPMCGRKLEEQ